MAKEEYFYWNPLLETLPEERLRKLQLEKFKRVLSWAYNNSPFYRDFYEDAGLEPEDIKSFEDISKVPKVEKSMLRQVQEKPPFPYGDMLAVPINEITTFRQTSGTTGTPVYQACTWRDWEWWIESWCYILYAQGFNETDRVFIPFGYNVFVAFWAAHYAAEKIGCEVVPGGMLDTTARILKIKELECTALMATPSYLLSMAEKAKNELNIDPATDLKVKKILAAGEPGASVPATKKRIQDAWNAKVYDHIGITEVGSWSYECTAQPGGQHVHEAYFLVEIEDEPTGEIISEPGKPGKMIITAFDRLGKPSIRFDSKDIIQWSAKRCACGRTFRLIDQGLLGRSDDITKVKGVLLSPTAVEEVIHGIPELGFEYVLEVHKRGTVDDLLLKVEILPEHTSRRDSVLERLKNQLRLKTNLGYRVEVSDYGDLPRYTAKAKRFIDFRKKG